MKSGDFSMDDFDTITSWIALSAVAVSGSVGLGLLLALVVFHAS
jgi:hypothetical protein